MQDELVTSRDAGKLSAGVAKDAINRYNAKENFDSVPLLSIPKCVKLNNVHKELDSVVLKWCSRGK